jgi:hypothetical protein
MEGGNKTPIDPKVLADVLLSEYVLKDDIGNIFYLTEEWKNIEIFHPFVITYKVAIVIISLLNHENNDFGFFPARIEFEKLVFSDGNIQKLYYYKEVKIVMDKLGELIDTKIKNLISIEDQNHKIPWVMSCLRDNGVLAPEQAIQENRLSTIGMGWAMAWLRDVGIKELNPVRLTQFSLLWMDSYLAVNRILDMYTPNLKKV